MSKYKQIISILEGSKAAISTLLTSRDDEHHRLKLIADIDRNIKYLSLLTNTPATESEKPAKLAPASTIAGKPIVRKEVVKTTDLEPGQQRIQVLRDKVEAAYPRFLKMETVFILNEFEDNVIRGVAKKAKMHVTKEDPEKITLDFIEEIKNNIRELEQRDIRNAQAKQEEELGMTGSGDPAKEPANDADDWDEEGADSSENEQNDPENEQNVSNSDTDVQENEPEKQQEIELKATGTVDQKPETPAQRKAREKKEKEAAEQAKKDTGN